MTKGIGLLVSDLLGRMVRVSDIDAQTGDNFARVDLSGCAAGVYLLRVTGGARSETRKVLDR
jgi:hypothetical protein